MADGSMTPSEAAERLAALDEPGPEAAEAGLGPVRRVRIASTGHAVRVVGDPRLRVPRVDGPHTQRCEGDTLIVEPEMGEEGGDFFIAAIPPWRNRDEAFNRMWRSVPPLVVRMPPDLALRAEVTAASVVVRDVKGPIGLAVAAGSARLDGFSSPVDIDVSAGSVSAHGVLDRGESTVRCSAGSVKLQLAAGSSVRLKGTANAGRLVFPLSRHAAARGPRGPFGPFGPFGEAHESVVGDGDGVLEVEVTTGSVVVRAEP